MGRIKYTREGVHMAGFSPTAHWRDSARIPRFFIIDARAAFPVFIFLMHIRIWTGSLVLVSMLFFGIVEKYGFSIPVFLRTARSFLAGSTKSAQPWWQ